MSDAARLLKRLGGNLPFPTLESLLTDPRGMGLTTASPLQRAVCRLIDGQPLGELALHPYVADAIGIEKPDPQGYPKPAQVLVLSGIRTGKSLIAAAMAIHASQTCDLSIVRPGEEPRVSLVSVSTDIAKVLHGHVVGSILASPALAGIAIGDPTSDAIKVRHPSGTPIEIKVVAGAKAGYSLVARWAAGIVFDEAPRMVGADEGVRNLNDAAAAVQGRLLPGATIAYIGSPWAPYGPAYDMYHEFFGKPSRKMMVVKAQAPRMNPVWWTEEQIEATRNRSEEAHRTDVLAEFADPEASLLPASEVDGSTRQAPLALPWQEGMSYEAAMDPATRGNSWTLIVGHREGGKWIIDTATQWTGSKANPLSPKEVLGHIKEILSTYRINVVTSDQWSADAIRDIAWEMGLGVSQVTVSADEKRSMFTNLKNRLSAGLAELPPNNDLRRDLLAVKRRVTTQGIQIILPRTADGRHADYAACLALLLGRYIVPERDKDVEEKPKSPHEVDTLEEEEMQEYEHGEW